MNPIDRIKKLKKEQTLGHNHFVFLEIRGWKEALESVQKLLDDFIDDLGPSMGEENQINLGRHNALCNIKTQIEKWQKEIEK